MVGPFKNLYAIVCIVTKWCRRRCGAMCLHYPFPLDEDKMRDAAARLVGSHDFRVICGFDWLRRGRQGALDRPGDLFDGVGALGR